MTTKHSEAWKKALARLAASGRCCQAGCTRKAAPERKHCARHLAKALERARRYHERQRALRDGATLIAADAAPKRKPKPKKAKGKPAKRTTKR
jgi:hypothetical protein